MKKKDLILIAAIFVIAGIFFGVHAIQGKTEHASVEIHVDGELYGTYELSKNQIINIQDTNTLEIRDGEAKMKKADCPDQICVNQKAISKAGESIICLPNKVVVSVVGGAENELDAVTN